MNKRTGLAWFQSRIWKLRHIRRDGEKRKCPLCDGDENEIHIWLKFNGTQRWQEKFWNKNRYTYMKK
jgi:hypothetical protein